MADITSRRQREDGSPMSNCPRRPVCVIYQGILVNCVHRLLDELFFECHHAAAHSQRREDCTMPGPGVGSSLWQQRTERDGGHLRVKCPPSVFLDDIVLKQMLDRSISLNKHRNLTQMLFSAHRKIAASSPRNFALGFLGDFALYFFHGHGVIVSAKRIRIVAAWARVACPRGTSRLSPTPVISPWSTAQIMADCAQLLVCSPSA